MSGERCEVCGETDELLIPLDGSGPLVCDLCEQDADDEEAVIVQDDTDVLLADDRWRAEREASRDR